MWPFNRGWPLNGGPLNRGSTVIHIIFRHCIALNRQRLPNSRFNIQLTNCPRNLQKKMMYRDLHGLSLTPTTKMMSVISEMDTCIPLNSPSWLNNTMNITCYLSCKVP